MSPQASRPKGARIDPMAREVWCPNKLFRIFSKFGMKTVRCPLDQDVNWWRPLQGKLQKPMVIQNGYL